MRIIVGTVVATLILSAPLAALAEDYSACWVVKKWNETYAEWEQITRCRLFGGEIVDYADDDSVPSRLYPRPGTDDNGPCWYYSSADANWVIVELYADGDAILGFTISNLGGFAVVTERIPRCTSEPTPDDDPIFDVWSYVNNYVHAPPSPDLNPEQGDGVTGLATYLGVDVPEDHEGTLTSAGTVLEVEIEVAGVTVDWGDDTTDTFPADPEALSGYPGGIATHVYEVKDDGFLIDVSYQWAVRWRVVGGTWFVLVVPDTATTVDYPVSEIISVITG